MTGFIKLFQYLKNYKSLIALHVVFTILMVLFNTLSFVMSEPFLKILFERTDINLRKVDKITDLDSLVAFSQYQINEYVVANGQVQALAAICVLTIGVFFFKNLFRYLAVLAIAPARFGVVRDVRQQIFNKILSLPLSFYSEEKRGDIIGKMITDVQEIEQSVLSTFEVVVREPLMIIASLAVMIYISIEMTLVSFLLIVLVGIVIGGVGRRLKKQSLEAQNKLADLISIVDETISGLRIIKGFNALNYQQDKFGKDNNAYRWMRIKITWRTGAASPLSEFLGIVVVVALLWYGGSKVFNGDLVMETFLLFLVMFYNMIGPAKSITKAYYHIQKGLGAVERIEGILNVVNPIKEKPNALPIASLNHAIRYQDISFRYDESRTVLNNINIDIPKGKIIALVGASGAGKSTLVDLLPRFYDVSKGKITIDGHDLKDYKLEDLRSLMGIVSQSPILFNDTIASNIAFGKKGVSQADIEAAAKVANAHDFILETPHGYQTNIGDSGVKLSGGQRQRLTIARAVLKNPEILILDEATSSLDSESERLVQDALAVLMQNRTSIVIAHRLSTIQHADEIIVLQDGIIIERGNHEALMNKRGAYSRLVELQKL